ncbi:MAG: DUF3035 domain-containing protein [Rhodospirillales bacterium]|nr:DUF3035 domain-containing protein [Rhodospirillales bacterium]
MKIRFPAPRRSVPLLLLAASLALGGCGEARKVLGWEKAPPDEFRIVSRAPLTVPPDFGLRPPAPGAARPNEASAQDAARTAVFGPDRPAVQSAAGRAASGSAGEQQLLGRIGADRIDPGIREQIDRETQSLAEADKTFVDRLLFWRPNDPAAGQQLDAAREAQRLRETSAAGRPANEGEIPTIKKRQRGFFEGIF